MLELVVRRARLPGAGPGPVDIGIEAGRIVAVAARIDADCPELHAQDRLVLPGLVDTHLHLDKSRTADRCVQVEGTLAEAIRETARIKAAFTEQDVYERARETLEACVLQGTTRIRTHVEVDPAVGTRGLDAVRRLAADLAWASFPCQDLSLAGQRGGLRTDVDVERSRPLSFLRYRFVGISAHRELRAGFEPRILLTEIPPAERAGPMSMRWLERRRSQGNAGTLRANAPSPSRASSSKPPGINTPELGEDSAASGVQKPVIRLLTLMGAFDNFSGYECTGSCRVGREMATDLFENGSHCIK